MDCYNVLFTAKHETMRDILRYTVYYIVSYTYHSSLQRVKSLPSNTKAQMFFPMQRLMGFISFFCLSLF